jgi:hypothetical protein
MPSKRLPLFEETRSTILQRFSSWRQLVPRLNSLRLEPGNYLQVAVMASATPLEELLQSTHSVRRISSNDTTGRYSLSARAHVDSPESIKGEFLLLRTEFEDVTLALFIEPLRFWKFGLRPVLDCLYPKAVSPFYTQLELHSLLKNIQQVSEGDRVRILRLSSRERLVHKTARKRYASILQWTDAELENAFHDAKADNVWFRSVAFEIVHLEDKRLVSSNSHALLSKYGYFYCDSNFELFNSAIVLPMVTLAHERFQFLSKRDRRSTPQNDPKPVRIKYDTEIFASVDQIRKLVEAMKKFRKGTCSVLHGNPYMHVSVVDNIDNSSADVWVVGSNDIIIVPQIKTSQGALKRIINHIFEHFQEGKLSEYTLSPNL